MERNINIDIVSNMMQREREFWKSKLNNEFIKTTMPFKNYESNEGYTNKVTVHGIKEDNFRKIQKICRNSQEKIFMFLYSTLVVLAYKYTNNKYIAIESPIFKQKEDKNVMNSVVPFFEEILGTYTFKEVLLKAKSTIEQSYENGSYPINKIYDLVDEVNYDKESPLTDIVFLMDNLQDKKLIENLNGRLSFIFSLEEYGIYLTLQYNKEFYINEATNKIFEHIENILESVLNNVEIQIDQIDILSKEEKELLLVGFNETKKEYFMEKTIQELFEEQVKKTPNKVALKFDGRKITYDKLNQKANALSKVLRKKGVKSDDIVGIFLQRSEDMIVAMLAILKSGAAYLPIDPNYPIDRINFILEDSRAPIVITGSKWKSHVTYDGMIVNIDEIEVDRDSNNPIVLNNSNDLAYVIYTSGSTGNPKGVMIEHKQVNNFIEGVANETNIIKHESILCITTISFDIFVLETLLPITKGLTVSITKDDISIDGDLIGEIIEKDDIKVIQSTPSRMKLFLQSSRFRKSLEKVKVLLIGGDTLPITLLNELKKYSLDIYNMYGPTETTVWSTIRKIENEDRINIGKPIQNTKVYILDKRLTLRPIGAIGEVYISGDGIGRGYLNNEKLTEQKFILNPFECNEKMYSTGDVGRWLPDGNIELLGRIDYQVKIRGFRIELGEIESNLQKLDGIKEAVVLAKGEITNQYLCAYYESEEKYSSYELKDFLEKDLPEYMMPSYFIYLQSMPLTPNGKIDRKQLLKIEEKIDSIDEYVAPTNKIEKKLVEIFEEVLQIKNIGINDNIFNTGAHSLTVAILVGKIYKEFNVEISMKEIFMLQTIKEIAQCIESKENRIFQGIETIEKREYYEASSSQKRMYIIQDFDKENVAYNMPCIFEVQGSIDKSKIEDTFKKLVLRHEALRTYFEIVDGEIVQKVVSDYEFSLNSRRETKPIEIVIENFIKPFDLRKLPLFRIEMTEVEDKNYLLIDMHHIICDGISMSVLIKEFGALYNGQELESLKIQYKDFAASQNNLLKSEKMKKQEEYWINMFNYEVPVLDLPYDYERPALQSFEGGEVRLEVNKNVVSELKKITRKTGTTMHMVLLSSFYILLSKYSRQEDIVIGTPIAGRTHADIQNIMGMFVNTLALRNKPEGNKKYIDFLNEVKENSLMAYENQSYQLETLIEKLNIVRDTSRSPLFDVMFNMVDTISDIDIKLKDMLLIPYSGKNNVAKFDLTLNAMEQNDEIAINIEYCSKLFNKSSIERLGKHYLIILESITTNNEIKLGEIELLSDEEKNQLLNEFNDTKIEYENDKTIQELFESQVEKTPDNIAVIFEDKKLTYRELNEKSNSLARVLRTKGIKADSIVAVMVDRSLEMIVGIMGILKAGGAYLPIDPKYPKDRIEYILKDSETKILLSKSESVETLEFDGTVIDLFKDNLFNRDFNNLEKINSSKNLAYVIYTSGTTGNPKGAMIEHRALVNRLLWMQNKYPLNEEDTVLQKTTYTFDVSVWEFLWWSLVGAKVCILSPNDEKDSVKIIEVINKYKITTMHFVPSMLDVFLYCLEESKKALTLNSLRQVFCSGEALKFKQVSRFYKEFGNSKKLINLYGPTEATIDVSYFETTSNFDVNVIPIGKPISNINLYILDKNRRLQPIGVAGELCISGDGLARGYLNKSELTTEKFVDNPFEPGTKMYTTGDLAKWLPDGNIEFLGRIDNQVKIRGFRIELGEIENKLLQHEDVKEATVIVIEDKDEDKYICAYIVSEKEVNELNLKDYLKESLPEYMVPSYFVKLDKMPITFNGKLDRRALPKPNLEDRLTSYEAPRNAIEETLVRIWSEVLGVDKIGINDSFFELGGDSIKAIRIISKLNKSRYILDVKDLFNNPNIRDVSNYVSIDLQNNLINQEDIVGQADLTPIQSWFFNQNFKEMNQWNQSVMLFKKDGFEEIIINKVFNKILKQHDALRMIFKKSNDKIVQFNRESKEGLFELKIFNYLSEVHFKDKIKEECEVLQKSLNIWDGELIKLGLFKTNEGDYLAIIIHHLVVDGISWRILFEDFQLGYKQSLNKEEIVIQEKTNSYLEWQKAIEYYAYSKDLLSEVDYWSKIENVEDKELPIDREINIEKRIVKHNKSIKLSIDEEYTENLLKKVNKAYNTSIDDILLIALALSIEKWTGNNNVIINMENHGRENIGATNLNVNRTVGWFTSEYPVDLRIDTNKDIGYNLKSIKETLRKIPNKGIGYNILKYYRDDIFVSNVKPQISFNYLGDFNNDSNNDIFQISELSTGNAVSKDSHMLYKIDINAVINNGVLVFAFGYNSYEFNDDNVNEFVQKYKECLYNLINHCINKKQTEMTPSDVSNYNVSIEQLEMYEKNTINLKEEDEFENLQY